MIDTLAEFEALPSTEQIRLERIAFVMEAAGVDENEAIAIVTNRQESFKFDA